MKFNQLKGERKKNLIWTDAHEVRCPHLLLYLRWKLSLIGGLEGLALPSGIMLQTHLSDAWSLLEWPREEALQDAQN